MIYSILCVATVNAGAPPAANKIADKPSPNQIFKECLETHLPNLSVKEKHKVEWNFFDSSDGEEAMVYCKMPGVFEVSCDSHGLYFNDHCPKLEPTTFDECADFEKHALHKLAKKKGFKVESIVQSEEDPLKAYAYCGTDGFENIETEVQCKHGKKGISFEAKDCPKPNQQCPDGFSGYGMYYKQNDGTHRVACLNGSTSSSNSMDSLCNFCKTKSCGQFAFDAKDAVIETQLLEWTGKPQVMCKWVSNDSSRRSRDIECKNNALHYVDKKDACPSCDDSILKKDRYETYRLVASAKETKWMAQCKYGGWVDMECRNGKLQLKDNNVDCPACSYDHHPEIRLDWDPLDTSAQIYMKNCPVPMYRAQCKKGKHGFHMHASDMMCPVEIEKKESPRLQVPLHM